MLNKPLYNISCYYNLTVSQFNPDMKRDTHKQKRNLKKLDKLINIICEHWILHRELMHTKSGESNRCLWNGPVPYNFDFPSIFPVQGHLS